MTRKEVMTKKLEEYIDRHPDTTFPEIESLFDAEGFDYEGNRVIAAQKGTVWKNNRLFGENIVFWAGWNKDALDVLSGLINGNYHFKSCDLLIYMIDGKCMTIPMAKNPARDYRNPHWFPVVINRD